MTADLTAVETSALWAMTARTWTPTTHLPADALTTLKARGLVEVSPWAEYARITGAGAELFEVVSA